MSKDDFAPGEEVKHKSGGPKMIYTGEDEKGEAMCEWMDGATRKKESIPYAALTKFSPRATGAKMTRG